MGEFCPATSRADARRFFDGQGQVWRAWEELREAADGTSARVLIFMSDHAIRCVTRFPANWAEQSAAELERTSWGT